MPTENACVFSYVSFFVSMHISKTFHVLLILSVLCLSLLDFSSQAERQTLKVYILSAGDGGFQNRKLGKRQAD